MASSSTPHHMMPIFERQNFRFGRSESPCPRTSVGPEIIITDWLLVFVSAVFFGLRIYSKFMRNTSLWWDDHVLLVAWVSHQPYMPLPSHPQRWQTSRMSSYPLTLSNLLFMICSFSSYSMPSSTLSTSTGVSENTFATWSRTLSNISTILLASLPRQ